MRITGYSGKETRKGGRFGKGTDGTPVLSLSPSVSIYPTTRSWINFGPFTYLRDNCMGNQGGSR